MSAPNCQQCGHPAFCYALDPFPNGWGGYFCLSHVPIGWKITDYVHPNGR